METVFSMGLEASDGQLQKHSLECNQPVSAQNPVSVDVPQKDIKPSVHQRVVVNEPVSFCKILLLCLCNQSAFHPLSLPKL